MEINHPKHYNQYPVEVIDMMIRIFGEEQTRTFCLLNAFKYRMRVGHKDDIQDDLAKEKWYLDKAHELSTDFHERVSIALGADRIANLMEKVNRDIDLNIAHLCNIQEPQALEVDPRYISGVDPITQTGVNETFKPSTSPDIFDIPPTMTGY